MFLSVWITRMGHHHLVHLPPTVPWLGVLDALRAPSVVPADVATATAFAASDRLVRLRDDPCLAYCFWVLARVTSAAARPDFVEGLAALGVRAGPSDSVVGVIGRIAARVREEVERHPESGQFGEMASLSLRRALTETVGTEGRSLFGSSLEDMERAFRRHATPARFGELAHRFFGDLTSRTLRFYVDKELSQHVGQGFGLATTTEAVGFTAELDRYTRGRARVVEVFAEEWWSKRDWLSGGAIGRDEAHGFVAHAVEKLQDALTEPAA